MSKSDEADRKAIRRVFQTLIERGILKAKGVARSRTYILVSHDSVPLLRKSSKSFHSISLTTDAKALLQYLSQPLQTRHQVGYKREFLASYKPNRTFYLSAFQRGELFKMGAVENKARPAGTYVRQIMNRLLIDLSWNSSRLEGNTYSLLETKRLVELGESAEGKNVVETQMILNHKGAIEYLVEGATEEKITFHEVCSIHALLSENLLGDPSASGRIRQIAVGVGGSSYLPLENPHVIKEHFQIFIEKLNLIKDPFEQSFFSLVHLSYLQAFEDVNKRTSRLVANIPLIKKNLKPLSFIDVEQEDYVTSLLGVYEKNDISLLRELYIWAYKRSSYRYSAIQQAMGEPNLLKLKYRTMVQEIVQTLVREKISGARIVKNIKNLLELQKLPQEDKAELFKLIETEILSLHEGNIARFKILPKEFQEWRALQ